MHFFEPENMFTTEMQLLFRKCNLLHGVGIFHTLCFLRKLLILRILLHIKIAITPLTAFVAATENALKAGGKVQLVGFGTFEAKVRAAHIGRNPATGAEIKIPASKAPAFKAGKTFKDSVQ